MVNRLENNFVLVRLNYKAKILASFYLLGVQSLVYNSLSFLAVIIVQRLNNTSGSLSRNESRSKTYPNLIEIRDHQKEVGQVVNFFRVQFLHFVFFASPLFLKQLVLESRKGMILILHRNLLESNQTVAFQDKPKKIITQNYVNSNLFLKIIIF